jgi:hypothetical protein
LRLEAIFLFFELGLGLLGGSSMKNANYYPFSLLPVGRGKRKALIKAYLNIKMFFEKSKLLYFQHD